MAVVTPAPPALSGELSLFHTIDPLLSNSPVLVFHGPSATIGAASSRIQVHVFTPAGCGNYARLAVSPNSPFYTAVSNLPREEQGDEVIRGLAFGLKKYFTELPDGLKKAWCAEAKAPVASALFGDEHVAILASRMTRVDNVDEVIEDITRSFGEQRLSWLDVDVVLPGGSIRDTSVTTKSEDPDEPQALAQRYGKYAELVDSLGDVAFVPTSKLKRAPSKASTIGRSASFLRSQKENVRKEICELLDTEENYVQRMSELDALSKLSVTELSIADQHKLRKLFPTSISEILRVNEALLVDMRAVVQATQKAAQQDIASTSPDACPPLQVHNDFANDTQGANAIANCLCENVPHFSESYRHYTQSHVQSTQLMRDTLKDADSSLAAHLCAIGEQKLSSLLIEPIQRLPRYNLYIDSIVKQLPMRHPAIKPLLSARDIITQICDQEDLSTLAASTIASLTARVSDWPADSKISGRLVTAVDYAEWLPPYRLQGCEDDEGMLLLFTDALVLLEKSGIEPANAKKLLTEIESGSAIARTNRSTTRNDLRFVQSIDLDAVDCLEVLKGEGLVLMTNAASNNTGMSSTSSKVDSYQIFRLRGSYERKAERLAEEIAKARVEGRFSELERESAKWEVLASDPMADSTSLLSAVFEDSNQDFTNSRRSIAPVRVMLDLDRHTNRPRAGQKGIRTVASVSPLRDGMWRLAIDSVDGGVSPEHVAASDLVIVLRRKLAVLTAARLDIARPALSACLLAKNREVLQSIDLQFKSDEDDSASQTSRQERTYRPLSPRKLLSNFLSSTGPGSQSPLAFKKDLPPLPATQVPRITPVNLELAKPPSRDSRPSSKDQPTPKSTMSMRSMERPETPLKKLENTLSAYLLALQARKGNIVGRNLKLRASADELAVNELYNSLIEDPNMMVLAAQASLDVLFAAFEKFLNFAWKDEIGPVLPYPTLQEIQTKAETLFPTDFDEYFRSAISTLAPQNQRAFKSVMKLLADLLDGTGNDSDRGTLTCAFAEVLVTEGNPYDYIALIDRFVDDPDTYFGAPLDEVQKAGDAFASMHKRARSTNSASITSNTSSLRKKFGFGLARENSKSEPESKMASVWRSLSKSTRGDASPAASISRGTLHRSHSTDVDIRGPPSRPVSQDGASVHLSTFEDGASFTTTSSAYNAGLSTIGEHPSFIPKQPPRKKRRSSLSDLRGLEGAQQKSPGWSSPALRPPLLAPKSNMDKSLPNSPMPSTPSSRDGSGRFGSPSKEHTRSRLPASFRKENSPGPARALATGEQRPKSSDGKAEEVIITARPGSSGIPTFSPRTISPQKPTATPSIVPPRTGLAERPGAGNIVKKASPSPEKAMKPVVAVTETGSPKKLRMQSPQKLRERLQNEQNNIMAAHASLQDELSKIGDELSLTPSRMGSNAMRSRGGNAELVQRVVKVESQLSTQVDELTARIDSVKSDLTSSLSVSESKCKKLDELYREANAENEALYSRFNDDLDRILKAVRDGEGVEELKKKLKETQEEAAKMKRENARLKRENLGLRAQLKE